MKRIGGVLEGLILLVVGAYAGLLALYGDYWRYLNPRFKWLTGLTAAMLILIGVVATFKPRKRPSLSGIVLFLVLLRILFLQGLGITENRQAAVRPAGENHARDKSRVVMNGQEYIGINLAELYVLSREGEPDKLAGHYRVKGIVKRSEQLDRAGQIVMLRSFVTCCLADMVMIGFRVQYNRFDELADGQWVDVHGTLGGLSKDQPEAGLRVRGVSTVALAHSHILVPDSIVKIDEPEVPFIFDIRKTEPYAY